MQRHQTAQGKHYLLKKENKVSSLFDINFVLSVGATVFSDCVWWPESSRSFIIRAGQQQYRGGAALQHQQQCRVLTPDNDHHYPDIDTCSSALWEIKLNQADNNSRV